MTKPQIHFASSHDWFRYAHLSQGIVFVQDYNDKNEAYERKFSNFKLLMEWAGY